LYQQVTYKYYTGRLEMFEGDYKKAAEALSLAFERCSPQNRRNKRLALLYLLPARLISGYIPKPELLRKHRLEAFIPVIEALKKGDVAGLDAALQTHQEFFIRTGVALVLQRLRMHVFRRLFKKVYRIMNTNKIPLAAFAVALRWQNIGMELAEIECILANLIFAGQIRGYLAHKAQFLVLAKDNAFPSA